MTDPYHSLPSVSLCLSHIPTQVSYGRCPYLPISGDPFSIGALHAIRTQQTYFIHGKHTIPYRPA